MKITILISIIAISAIAIYKLAGDIKNLPLYPLDLNENIDDELKNL